MGRLSTLTAKLISTLSLLLSLRHIPISDISSSQMCIQDVPPNILTAGREPGLLLPLSHPTPRFQKGIPDENYSRFSSLSVFPAPPESHQA